MSELKWRWVSDSVPSDSVACTSTSGAVCSKVMISSGTMFTTAYVNGEQQQKSVHSEVRIPHLDLAASQYVLAAPGDSDTFTPSGNGVVVVQGWHFTPDSAEGGSASRIATPSAGVLRTRLPSGAPPTGGRSPAMAPSRPTYSVSVGNSWDQCGPSAPICENFVANSGTVEVIATVNGVQLTATVHVTVIPCPTGDSRLDDPKFRQLMKLVWDSSDASNSDITKRTERMGVVLYDTRTKTYTYQMLPLNSVDSLNGPCQVNAQVPAHTLDVIIAAILHSHPFQEGERFGGNCRQGQTGAITSATRRRTRTGWGSGTDWHTSQIMHTPSYIIDAREDHSHSRRFR